MWRAERGLVRVFVRRHRSDRTRWDREKRVRIGGRWWVFFAKPRRLVAFFERRYGGLRGGLRWHLLRSRSDRFLRVERHRGRDQRQYRSRCLRVLGRGYFHRRQGGRLGCALRGGWARGGDWRRILRQRRARGAGLRRGQSLRLFEDKAEFLRIRL